MIKKNTTAFFVVILMLCFVNIGICNTENKSGKYSIKLNLKEGIRSGYLKKGDYIKLYKAQWGNDIIFDSIKIKSNVNFKGNNPLEEGEYTIKNESGINLLEFMISSKENINESFKLIYNNKNKQTPEPDRIIHKKGNKENNFFIALQNIAAQNFNNNTTFDKLKKEVTSICNIASKECEGTLLDYMCKYSFMQNDSVEEFISNFPLNDKRIINTRFCKISIDNLLNKIELNSNNTIMQYIERLISKSSEELKPYLIANLFYYFQEPQIMGQESIAIDLAKKYFNEGNVKWPYNDSYLPKAFTFMNENSLIGMQAPELNLEDTLGRKVSLRSLNKEYTVIYFYTDDCITCKVETPKLIEFLNSYSGYHINVYAVYTGDNKEIWKKYIDNNFKIENSYVNWINVYDPNLDSNFPLLYGVVTTPKIYLINKEKYIIGRRLNTNNLRELLYIENHKTRK